MIYTFNMVDYFIRIESLTNKFGPSKVIVIDLRYVTRHFRTISVRSVYIRIINYSGSIHVLHVASLNNSLQTKQHAMKKP